jgi:predicted nucleic acid-binding Zn finger protein
MKKLMILSVALIALIMTSCTDADVASQNLRKAAEQFEVFRRVVFYNGITDSYILSVEGYCSIEDYAGQLEVTIKTSEGTYLKHHLGLSDNVTYFSEQIDPKNVSTGRYRVIFKPSVIIPNVDIE